MRTLRLSLIGTVILVLLGGLGGAALAQMDADADAVYTTLVSLNPVSADTGSVLETDTLYSSRDGTLVGVQEWTDPRMSGEATTTFHVDVDLDTGQGLMWGTVRLENDGGTWEGPFNGMVYEPPGEDGLYMNAGWMTGDGDYAGYTFYWEEHGEQNGGPISTLHGVIYKGEPMPAE
jgi:hypothetical protein